MYGSMHHDDAPQIAIIEVLKRGTIWEDQNCHHFNQRSAILWNLDYAVVVLACTRIDRRSTKENNKVWAEPCVLSVLE